jgi:hypothetical protein
MVLLVLLDVQLGGGDHLCIDRQYVFRGLLDVDLLVVDGLLVLCLGPSGLGLVLREDIQLVSDVIDSV